MSDLIKILFFLNLYSIFIHEMIFKKYNRYSSNENGDMADVVIMYRQMLQTILIIALDILACSVYEVCRSESSLQPQPILYGQRLPGLNGASSV